MIAIEWLRTLDERKSGYRDLLDQEGDLPRAAWRLARARNQASNSFADLPSRREIAAAASAIARRLGVCSPEAKTLAEDCEAYGLPVL